MPSSPFFALKRVLVPTDLSAPSARALAYAVAFARQFDAELILLNVYEPLVSAPRHATALDTQRLSESIHQSMKWEIEQFAKPLIEPLLEKAGAAGTSPIRIEIRDGLPVDEIVAAAKEGKTDLLIISTHGRTGLRHVLMGSTAEKVVRHAPCPVLVVREHEHDFIKE